ncbi:hypothetical protein HDU91_000061 [Kappamyces sp. JEL0680]|nr:hypothetical protein HDU91_000061 [Kappamyces sp. JEL0680]
MAEVEAHNSRDSCWLVYRRNVYDLTNYIRLETHPGGIEAILDLAGLDATLEINEAGHSINALEEMETYLIGALAES